MFRSTESVTGFYTIQEHFCDWMLPYLVMSYWILASAAIDLTSRSPGSNVGQVEFWRGEVA